jgi:hypothetical protein
MKYKALGIVFVVAIGAAVVAVLYYWQMSHQPIPGPVTHQVSVTYTNKQYGYQIGLTEAWKGFTVINNQWEGRDTATGKLTETGPQIVLRHPLWTAANPREDMPVMVITLDQWSKIKSGQVSVGAAPFPPTLLGQNSKYVLALPARYNYDFKPGSAEVDRLVRDLKAFEPSK